MVSPALSTTGRSWREAGLGSAKAEEGLSADVLLLLMSPSSSPTRWVRERWKPVLFKQATQAKVEVVTMLLEECSFPPLLRRRNFIDATANWLTAWRLLKPLVHAAGARTGLATELRVLARPRGFICTSSRSRRHACTSAGKERFGSQKRRRKSSRRYCGCAVPGPLPGSSRWRSGPPARP